MAAASALVDLPSEMDSDSDTDSQRTVPFLCNAPIIPDRNVSERKQAKNAAVWESAVKSAKTLLTKVLHNHRLVYDELSTVLAEIEAILNSRPLSAMCNDPNDLQPLTAGHFLTGAPLRCINDSILKNSSKIKQWANLVEIKNEFWKRWTKEYLCELQRKKKWRDTHPNVIVGNLVTLKDQNLPPLQWRMGKITEIMPDKDGVVRVVHVKTATGMFTRAIHEFAPLPSSNEENDENDTKHH